MSKRKYGLAPLIDVKTEILILGTLPSDVSLSKAQYYAKPSNDFWKLLETVLNEPIANATYEAKIEKLSAHKIGLWDVYHSVVRPGSMDKDISERRLNDFTTLKRIAPNLRLVCFNGKEAAHPEELLRGLGYTTRVLPSSSGANRRNQEKRLRCWMSLPKLSRQHPDAAGLGSVRQAVRTITSLCDHAH
jgi:hypoxanthine-DNA glycosylase